MASTSTNKQPLLIDRPLHRLMSMSGQKTGNAGYWLSNNSCQVLVDCTQNDGALIEDIYLLSRDATEHTISLFMSTSVDVLRESDTNNTFFVGQFTTADPDSGSAVAGGVVHYENMPYQIAPYPSVSLDTANTRSSGQFRGFYLPRGYAMWAGRAVVGTEPNLDLSTCPVLGAQGGFY